jgi:hypothetical protein
MRHATSATLTVGVKSLRMETSPVSGIKTSQCRLSEAGRPRHILMGWSCTRNPAGRIKMLRSISLALLLAIAPASAFANSCPTQMAAIDAALPTASLSEADMTKVKELRKQGEDLHNAGDHAGSEAALGEAKKMLGI